MISWVWKCISVLTGVNWGESSKKENALQEIIHKSEVTGIPVNISCNQTLDNEFFFFHIVEKIYIYFPNRSKGDRYIWDYILGIQFFLLY